MERRQRFDRYPAPRPGHLIQSKFGRRRHYSPHERGSYSPQVVWNNDQLSIEMNRSAECWQEGSGAWVAYMYLFFGGFAGECILSLLTSFWFGLSGLLTCIRLAVCIPSPTVKFRVLERLFWYRSPFPTSCLPFFQVD
ncbi:hypothetical protein VTN02DRAFT_6384 [Thermoascus thermophilus]